MPTKKILGDGEPSTGTSKSAAKSSRKSTAPSTPGTPNTKSAVKTAAERTPKPREKVEKVEKAVRGARGTAATPAPGTGTFSGKRAVSRRKAEASGASVETHVEDFITPIKSRDPLTHEQIAVRAYYIAEQWRSEGREVTDEGIWLEAERQMRAERGWNS